MRDTDRYWLRCRACERLWSLQMWGETFPARLVRVRDMWRSTCPKCGARDAMLLPSDSGENFFISDVKEGENSLTNMQGGRIVDGTEEVCRFPPSLTTTDALPTRPGHGFGHSTQPLSLTRTLAVRPSKAHTRGPGR